MENMLIHMTELPELFERARQRSLSRFSVNEPVDDMDDIARMRAEAQRRRQMKAEQESVLGEESNRPVTLDEDVLQYYRQMGLPEEMILQGLGLKGK